MNKVIAIQVVGGLSKPSKMPCPSYNLPASACKTGSVLAGVENSTCSKCYCLDRGRYCFSSVKNAMNRRLDAINDPQWVDAMVELIQHELYFRWHDSGDVQSLTHLENINTIAMRTPDTHHWLPTREYGLVKEFLRKHGSFSDNLCVRVSEPMIDQYSAMPYGLPTSGVHKTKEPHGYACPAPSQDNKCGTCRACWDKSVEHVSYNYH